MVDSHLSIAEQRIDRQARTELFRGRQIELVTGRVLLHALDDHGQSLCGHDRGQLTPVGQPWDAGYLPHLPRCQSCMAQVTDTPPPGPPAHDSPPGHDSPPAHHDPPGRAAQAGGVDIRTAHDTGHENAASAALRAVLAEHDLRRWMFTDLVTIDEAIRGGLSHPLTISPRLLVQRPALTLTTFLHEQLHWLEGPGTGSASAEASKRWPDPPPLPAGGGTDPTSTWLHMSVCALEYHSLSEILGPSAAAAELRQHAGYSWIYGQILASPDWFSGFLHRHGLQIPAQPPVPRRCFSETLRPSPQQTLRPSPP
jgi:hypothetical protein